MTLRAEMRGKTVGEMGPRKFAFEISWPLTIVSKSSLNCEHMDLMLGETALDFKDIKVLASG